MESLFLKLLNMSINASWLVLAIIIIRIIFKNAPKFIRCILWGLVGLRLILPISPQSVLSLIPSGETIPPDIIYSKEPSIHSGIAFLNSTVNPIISGSLAPTPTDSSNPIKIIVFIATIVWLVGVLALVVYSFLSYIRIKKRVLEAIPLKENIFICDRIDTPFILGIIKPQIYLPSVLNEGDTDFVIAHEKAHIKRRDHLWKPIGFMLLTVYWFNPLMWVGYILLCRDIELACDEKVLRSMGAEIKKPYSEALINCSVPRKLISACPLAFGEAGVKNRIKSVLSYKKPAFWVIIVAVILCIVTAVCFLTNPKDTAKPSSFGIVNTVSSVGYDGVKFEFVDGSIDKHNPYIEIKWVNHTKELLCYGNPFSLYYEGKEVKMDEGYGWTMPLYLLKSGGTSSDVCSLAGFDISRSGKYRLEKEFHFDSNSNKKYKASIEFQIDRRFSFIGLQYKGEKIIFSDGMYSSILFTDQSIPQYCISNDMHLYTSEHPKDGVALSSLYDAGELESFSLAEKNFDKILNLIEWESGYSAKYLRETNKNAFKVINKKDNRLYYLLEQENGEVFLAYGYADRNTIRWIFKLGLVGNMNSTIDDSVGIYIYNDSPEPITAPSLTLNYTDKTFHFSWSLFSSYLAMGNFEYERYSVICTTEDGKNTYVFHKTDYGYVFDGKRSSQIPSYKYSADAESAECPVPDGAKFEAKPMDNNVISGSGLNFNPSFKAKILEVRENSILVEPLKGEQERNSCDKIYVSTDLQSTNSVPELKKGDEVTIVYNGSIGESYPANITTVFSINVN